MSFTSKDLRELMSQPKPRHGDFLYIIQAKQSGHLKIGRTKDVPTRLRSLQTGNSDELRLIMSFEGWGWRERRIHEDLKKWRLKGEWFLAECIDHLPIDIYELIDLTLLD
jgi:hypothetical protein